MRSASRKRFAYVIHVDHLNACPIPWIPWARQPFKDLFSIFHATSTGFIRLCIVCVCACLCVRVICAAPALLHLSRSRAIRNTRAAKGKRSTWLYRVDAGLKAPLVQSVNPPAGKIQPEKKRSIRNGKLCSNSIYAKRTIPRFGLFIYDLEMSRNLSLWWAANRSDA